MKVGNDEERLVRTPDKIQVQHRLIRVGCRVVLLENMKIATRIGRSICDPMISRAK